MVYTAGQSIFGKIIPLLRHIFCCFRRLIGTVWKHSRRNCIWIYWVYFGFDPSSHVADSIPRNKKIWVTWTGVFPKPWDCLYYSIGHNISGVRTDSLEIFQTLAICPPWMLTWWFIIFLQVWNLRLLNNFFHLDRVLYVYRAKLSVSEIWARNNKPPTKS